MQGICLETLSGSLHRVPPEHEKAPVNAIERIASLTEKDARCFIENYHTYPLRLLKKVFSFDGLCKLMYSTVLMMDESVKCLFDTDPQYEVVRKIMNSMWRWGVGTGTWNEIVDAYENIRCFTFIDHPDFEIRLDHATHHNEFGRAKYSRIFIDGAFAFLIYYKGEHVLTIGFSIMEGRKLLIQQVQSAKRTGNRYLYQLPGNRLELVIDLFRRNFPGYQLSVIDGDCLAEKTLADYRNGLRRAKERHEHYRKRVDELETDIDDYVGRYVLESAEEIDYFEDKILHLEKDAARIGAFYRETGRFVRSDSSIKVNNLIHYQIAC